VEDDDDGAEDEVEDDDVEVDDIEKEGGEMMRVMMWPRPTVCVSPRNRHALGQLGRAIPQENLQEKCRAPEVSRTFCASLRSRTALGHIARCSALLFRT